MERHFSQRFTDFLGHRFEYAKLNQLSATTIREIGSIKPGGIVSGPNLEVTWDTIKGLCNAKRGFSGPSLLTKFANFCGEAYEFYNVATEAKKFHSFGWQTSVTGRVKVKVADAFGKKINWVIWGRFSAGAGKGSRGYGPRRLRPIGFSDDPLCRLRRMEGSVELRHPVWTDVTATAFFELGQVSAKAHNIPNDDLQFPAGFGVGYDIHFSPLQLDLGFPFDPPSGDSSGQDLLSGGQFF